jgi:hypothetical protein
LSIFDFVKRFYLERSLIKGVLCGTCGALL